MTNSNMQPKFILRLNPEHPTKATLHKFYLFDKSRDFIRSAQMTLREALETHLIPISAEDALHH